MEKPSLFIIINLGKAVRNFGRGGFLEAFINQGYRCVLFGKVPLDVQNDLKQLFGDDVAFEELGPLPLNPLAKAVQRLVTYTWRSRIDYDAVMARHEGGKGKRHHIERWLGRVLLQKIPVSVWEKWEVRLAQWPAADKLIAQYQPKGVMIINPVSEENSVINVCKRQGIYTFCLIESWDNLTIRGGLHSHPDDLYVWGDLMRREAVEDHCFPPERVHTVGLPSFDLYWMHDLYPSEAEWREQMNLPPNVPVINYTSSPKIRYKKQDLFVNMLLEGIQSGELPADTHILVRTHREDEEETYTLFQSMPNVRVQTADATLKGFDASMGQPLMLAATMRYSHVIVNLFSTTVLDAMANGTPAVSIAFNPKAGSSGSEPLQLRLKRFLNDKHIKDMLKFNAVLIAHNEADLVEHVGSCLKDKNANLENRQACLKAILANLEGQSTRQFAEKVMERIDQYYNH